MLTYEDADYDKDDLLGYGELDLLDDDKGGISGVEF